MRSSVRVCMSVLLAAVGLVSAAGIAPASAAAEPAVTVLSPEVGSTVALGDVPVKLQ